MLDFKSAMIISMGLASSSLASLLEGGSYYAPASHMAEGPLDANIELWKSYNEYYGEYYDADYGEYISPDKKIDKNYWLIFGLAVLGFVLIYIFKRVVCDARVGRTSDDYHAAPNNVAISI